MAWTTLRTLPVRLGSARPTALPGTVSRLVRERRRSRRLRAAGLLTPRLSVIVPISNSQDCLSGCLDSLLAQTLEAIEIILVDDGSTDHSAAIVADYARRDPRIRMVNRSR